MGLNCVDRGLSRIFSYFIFEKSFANFMKSATFKELEFVITEWDLHRHFTTKASHALKKL